MFCSLCQKEVAVSEPVGRRDECPLCRGDLRICKNCRFYDPQVYNECRESQADRVLEKDKSNFCDYFDPCRGTLQRAPTVDVVSEAKKKLEALFKK